MGAMDNVITLPFVNSTNRDETSFIPRILNALSGLPDAEQERIVRIFELMALSMEIELMEKAGAPGDFSESNDAFNP